MATTSAQRMRISRERRRDGMRCIPFEIRDEEIEALIRLRLLTDKNRDNREAIAVALGGYLSRRPIGG